MKEGLIQNAQGAQAVKAGKPTMQQYIKQMEGEIAKALPSVITPERFTRITLSALSANKQLAQTTPQSFLGAMMTAAQLGMEPNTPLGQAYLIPYRNHGQLECQFQLGYKGLIDLAYRSGEVSIIQAQVVYENYAMFRTKDGGFGYDVMSVEDVRNHAKRFSKAYSNGPWQTNFEEMAKKTVLKRVLKYAPLKSDFVRAVAQDETIKTKISEDMYSVSDDTVIEAENFTVDETTGEVIESDGDAQ